MTFATISARATSAILRHFAQPALLDEVEVEGVFDNAYAYPLGIASAMPVFTLASADAADAVQGSVLRIDIDGAATADGVPLSVNGAATVYSVRAVQPDGTGVTRLVLELAE